MTSINTMRFSNLSGVMLCDEQRHWNDERMKIFGADKIKPVIPEEIISRYGLVAAYGNTGTSSIGDEIRFKIKRKVHDIYRKRIELDGVPPDRFINLEDLAGIIFQVINEIKHDHVNEYLKNHCGFTTDDFIQGEYNKNGKAYKIKANEVVDKALKEISGQSQKDMGGAVFGNAGIMAGYSQEEGFQIYLYSMMDGSYEPVPSGFFAHGSGSDLANIHFSKFFNHLTRMEREGSIDRLEGVIAAIDAVNQAALNNLGVGGYFNIYLFDGNKPNMEKMIEINDIRSKFCSEMIEAHNYGFIEKDKLREVVEGLLYLNKPVEWASELIWNSVEDKTALHRFLRGYPEKVWKNSK